LGVGGIVTPQSLGSGIVVVAGGGRGSWTGREYYYTCTIISYHVQEVQKMYVRKG